ncbi:MAG: copper homeostasis protein CutC [Bacteroidota bacterium]
MTKYTLEIACDSVQSAINAQQGRADRIELCENLAQGGVTPSAAKIKLAKAKLNVPAFVLIRPRKGDFLYSNLEIETMLESIQIAKELGADGIVSGALRADGKLDLQQMKQLVEAASPLPFTCHRAFDMCSNPPVALERLIDLGVARILTSGQRSSAIEGKENIEKIVQLADGRIKIMAGAGIRPHNIAELFSIAGLQEFHSSAKQIVKSKMQYLGEARMGDEDLEKEFEWEEVSIEQVQALKLNSVGSA